MSTERKIALWSVGLLLVLLCLYLLRGMLLPFVAGMAVAYLLDPICDRLEKWGLSRTLSTIIVTAAFVILFAAFLIGIGPMLYRQIAALIQRLPEYIELIGQRLEPLVEQLRGRLEGGGVQQIGQQVGTVVGWGTSALMTLLSGGLAIVNVLALIFITPIVTFFLLRDWDEMVARIDKWLPRQSAPVIREQAALIDETLAGFVRGQALVCLLLGTFYAVALSAVGLEFGIIIGMLAGILSFIPYVGSAVGFVLSVGVALAQYPDWLPVIIVVGIFFGGQAIEGNFLTPKLVGDRVGLHPVWVIFALLAAGSLFGFVGVLLAVPVAAVIGVLARFALGRYLQSRYYRGGLPLTGLPPPNGNRDRDRPGGSTGTSS